MSKPSDNENSKETQMRLKGLQLMIQQVYIPALESKSEIKHHMNKFSSQISTSLQQAYGNVTINVPEIPPEMSDEMVGRDPRILDQLTKAVTEWATTIKDTIEREDAIAAQRLHDTASGETDFWNSRSATFNTLNQQLSMHSVKRIETILSAKDSASGDNFAMDTLRAKKQEFSKLHAQAKDFVKFLTTLERQFKVIGRGDLKGIEETLPSLLNGLKLIWTISKHIN